jgi:hypothetical protein
MGFTPSKNRTAPNPRFFGWFHIFANSELWLQLSICVLIISQCYIYVNYAVLDALSPPVLQFGIRSIFVESLRKIPIFRRYFTETQGILIGSHLDEWEVKEHPKRHNLRTYHIVIRSELKYLIGAKVLSLR